MHRFDVTSYTNIMRLMILRRCLMVRFLVPERAIALHCLAPRRCKYRLVQGRDKWPDSD